METSLPLSFHLGETPSAAVSSARVTSGPRQLFLQHQTTMAI